MRRTEINLHQRLKENQLLFILINFFFADGKIAQELRVCLVIQLAYTNTAVWKLHYILFLFCREEVRNNLRQMSEIFPVEREKSCR